MKMLQDYCIYYLTSPGKYSYNQDKLKTNLTFSCKQEEDTVSGGDETVKFWNFELIQDPDTQIKTKMLSVIHTRTHKLEENVLRVRVSSNNIFVAVSLLDCIIKIFFSDTFKVSKLLRSTIPSNILSLVSQYSFLLQFFVSLYGHELPMLRMDISCDSTLIVTGSADCNVKIWDLDFSECHKSMYAYHDSVMGLSFVPGTHCFFTSEKDGQLKQ